MRSRQGEEPRTWFRCDRFYRCNDRWYFYTREEIPVGPYASRSEAEVDAGLLIGLLKDAHPSEAREVIREFLMRTGGDLDILNDPAFTSYLTSEDGPAVASSTG
jgi:hypothetical protein